MKTDVLVAGAGPVGLAMAVGLARYGVLVRIVDKSAQRTDKSKALVLWSRTLERSEVGRQVLEATGRATSIALITGDFKQSIRNHIASVIFGLSPIRKAMAEVLTELSIGYPHSPLSAGGLYAHGGPAAGERAPIDPEETPLGAGATPRFALFAEDGAAASQ